MIEKTFKVKRYKLSKIGKNMDNDSSVILPFSLLCTLEIKRVFFFCKHNRKYFLEEKKNNISLLFLL